MMAKLGRTWGWPRRASDLIPCVSPDNNRKVGVSVGGGRKDKLPCRPCLPVLLIVLQSIRAQKQFIA